MLKPRSNDDGSLGGRDANEVERNEQEDRKRRRRDEDHKIEGWWKMVFLTLENKIQNVVG